jgi:hypothetical protein
VKSDRGDEGNFVPQMEHLFRERVLSAMASPRLQPSHSRNPCNCAVFCNPTQMARPMLKAISTKPELQVALVPKKDRIMKLSLKSIPVLATIAFICVAARATDLVWIGATGNWNLAGNWSPAQIPTATDNAWITNCGTYVVTVPAGSSATVNSVVVEPGRLA